MYDSIDMSATIDGPVISYRIVIRQKLITRYFFTIYKNALLIHYYPGSFCIIPYLLRIGSGDYSHCKDRNRKNISTTHTIFVFRNQAQKDFRIAGDIFTRSEGKISSQPSTDLYQEDSQMLI